MQTLLHTRHNAHNLPALLKDLTDIAAMVRGELPRLRRSILCSLITIDVHARDIVSTLVQDAVKSRYPIYIFYCRIVIPIMYKYNKPLVPEGELIFARAEREYLSPLHWAPLQQERLTNRKVHNLVLIELAP